MQLLDRSNTSVSHERFSLAAVSTKAAHESFASAVRDGLCSDPKSLPCRFLYDARGSALFEQITDIPEYYPTRTERSILRAHAATIATRGFQHSISSPSRLSRECEAGVP